jgi:transcriptional regulator with XRE-family HTH domain
MDINKEVGSRIRYYRTSKKLSQEKLSEYSNLHPSYIGQIERGEKTPSIETLYKITQGLDISLSTLLRDIDMCITEKGEDNYALKAYYLIRSKSKNNQKRLYNILQEIDNLDSK